MKYSPALYNNKNESKKSQKSLSFEKQINTQSISGNVTAENRLPQNNEIGQVFGNLPKFGVGIELEGVLFYFAYRCFSSYLISLFYFFIALIFLHYY